MFSIFSAAGTTGNVLIRNDSANGYVIADAVKFVLRPAELSAPTLKKTSINPLPIYPNPATNTIQFSGVNVNGKLITIYDLSGVQQMNIVGKQQTLDMSGLPPGMYVIMISGNKSPSGTFIKH